MSSFFKNNVFKINAKQLESTFYYVNTSSEILYYVETKQNH